MGESMEAHFHFVLNSVTKSSTISWAAVQLADPIGDGANGKSSATPI